MPPVSWQMDSCSTVAMSALTIYANWLAPLLKPAQGVVPIFRCVLSVALVSLMSSVTPVRAQDTLDVDALIYSVAEGDEKRLLAFAGERVELALLGQRRRYTRAQAHYVLHAFFRRYPPEAFTVDHSLSQQDEWWLTGQYVVRYNAEPMRVYLRFRGRFPVYRLLAIQIVRA